MEKGKPYVGAVVWNNVANTHYTVTKVTKGQFEIIWSDGEAGGRWSNNTFLHEDERPYITPTDILKALKNALSSNQV